MGNTINFGNGQEDYINHKINKQLSQDKEHNDPGLYFDAGEYFRNIGDIDQAHMHYKRAFELYYDLAKVGYPEAFYYLGYFYQYGFGVDKNIHEAEEYYTQAYDEFIAFEPNAVRSYLLGRLYESGFCWGQIGEPDYTKAAGYYALSSANGCPDALYRLGYIDALRKLQESK